MKSGKKLKRRYMKKLVKFDFWCAILAFLTILAITFLVVKIIAWWNFREPVLVDLSERACWLNTTQQVDEKAKEAVERIIVDAEKNGLCLVVSSGYRTEEEQVKIKEKYGDLAEEPGKSEHHTGLAVDFVACPMTNGKRDDTAERLELKKPFEELPEYEWLKKNAKNYGFKQSYKNEPWHWKLVARKEFYEYVSPVSEEPTPTPTDNLVQTYSGEASYYTNDYCVKYNPSCRTASGEVFDDTKFTMACGKEIRLGSLVKITHKGKSVLAKCNDRGSFEKKYDRIFDLSKATFEALSSLEAGIIQVTAEVIN